MLPLPSLSVSTKKETLLRGETPLELIADTRKLYAVKGSKSPTWKKLRHRLRHKLRQSPVLQFAISCSQWTIQNLSPATGGIWTQKTGKLGLWLLCYFCSQVHFNFRALNWHQSISSAWVSSPICQLILSCLLSARWLKLTWQIT